MKRFLLLLLIFISGIQLAICQYKQYDLFKERTRIDLPFQYLNNFIVVDVTLDDKVPLKFVFDTGAEYTILTKKTIAHLLRWRYEREFRIMGADLKTELVAYLVRNIILEVGKITIPHSNILVLEDDYFQFDEFTGSHIQGILGADFFKRFVVKINYRSKIISFFNPNSFKPPKGYQEVEVDIFKNKPYVDAAIMTKDTSRSKMRLLLDTGASLPLLLHTFTHKDLQIPEKYIKGNIGMGLGGFIDGYMGRLESMEVGPYAFNNLIANYQEYTPERDTSFLNGRNGLIGNQLLSRFNIIINYTREKLYLKANKNFYKEIKYDKSGILLLATGRRFTTFVVHEVIPSSPADQAGIRKGDIIKRINGLPSAVMNLRGVNRKFRKKRGKKIKLVIKRDGIRMKKTFVLEDLL